MATFDSELEERVGDVIGRELRAMGGNFFGDVCINLSRHPAWGRAQETYGEGPIHPGKFGAALVRGVQKHVMACAKHYALNSMAPLGLRPITGFQVLQHARRAATRLNPAAPGVLLDESGWGLVQAEQRFEVDFISQIRR